MTFTRHNQLIKLTPALIASLFDMTVTAIGQSPEYWSGNLQQANEANPVGGFFMSNHISGLFAASGVEILLIIVLGLYLPEKITKYLLLFVLIAHTCAAGSWLHGFWPVMGLALFNSIIYILAQDLAKKRASSMSVKT
ncbi:hypothetical protein [Marinoscillum pacificum]|uniref:hypothetical protein n=1 Tax=Marinoscillum pacificum TaxID=392723 RepID=UPI00215833D1|nr:hypothetical protein [Marinoscillum pacificum]